MGAACATPTNVEFTGKLKFVYFGGLKSRGYCVGLALEEGNVDYEFISSDMGSWFGPDSKAEYRKGHGTPFDYLPVLEFPDGTKVNECCACLFTVGAFTGLNGKDAMATGVSYMLSLKAMEMFTKVADNCPHFYDVDAWKGDGGKEKQKAAMEFKQTAKTWITQCEALCKSDGTFTGNSFPTTGEIHMFATLDQYEEPKFLTQMPPNLTKFMAKMRALPSVKRVLERQCKSGFDCNSMPTPYCMPIPDDVGGPGPSIYP